jgi:HAD superfamily hydrolase (TIGR01549 family)
MPIKCIAFDADNTLYSTRAIARDADMEAMRYLSMKTGDTPESLYDHWMQIVSAIKDSKDPQKRHRLYSYGVLCEEYKQPKEFAEEMFEVLLDVIREKLKLIGNAKEVLETLKKKKIALYVITEDDKRKAMVKLEKLEIIKFFDNVITSDDVGTMKPSEKYYEPLVRKFKLGEILVVGDDIEKDLSVPKKLGMQTLLVENERDLQKLLSIV